MIDLDKAIKIVDSQKPFSKKDEVLEFLSQYKGDESNYLTVSGRPGEKFTHERIAQEIQKETDLGAEFYKTFLILKLTLKAEN